jgi:DNA-binding PadR family transcriptional regulator
MIRDPITRHVFAGFIRLHILYHAAKEPTYGAGITEELIRHGYRLSQGTLYPTLHQLERLGYLRSRSEVIHGRRRKYYLATPAGRKLLAEARVKLRELIAEVIEDQDQPFQAIRERHRLAGHDGPLQSRPPARKTEKSRVIRRPPRTNR